MWSEIEDKRYNDSFNLAYHQDGFLIVEIYRTGSPQCSIVSPYKYVAMVTSYPYSPKGQMLFEDDLEVLKLKSLVSAKEGGWNIQTLSWFNMGY